MIVDGKKMFLKKLRLALMGGKVSELRVKYEVNDLELDDRDKIVIRFLVFRKREIIFETIFWIAGTQNQVPDRAFPWKFL